MSNQTPLEQIKAALAGLKEAREKATKGEWKECHHLKDGGDESCPCGFPGDIWSKDKDAVILTMASLHCQYGGQTQPEITDRAEVVSNGQFIALSANQWLNLLRVIELQAEALKKYTDPLPEKEVTHTLNYCADDCPRECKDHDYESKVKQRAVSHGSSIAKEAIEQSAAILSGSPSEQ